MPRIIQCYELYYVPIIVRVYACKENLIEMVGLKGTKL